MIPFVFIILEQYFMCTMLLLLLLLLLLRLYHNCTFFSFVESRGLFQQRQINVIIYNTAFNIFNAKYVRLIETLTSSV